MTDGETVFAPGTQWVLQFPPEDKPVWFAIAFEKPVMACALQVGVTVRTHFFLRDSVAYAPTSCIHFGCISTGAVVDSRSMGTTALSAV